MNTKKKIFLIIITVILLVIAYLLPNLNITTTSSLNKHIFYRVNKNKIEKGDYVTFKLPFVKYSSVKKYIGHLTTKRIGCMPGDRLVVKGTLFYCNDLFLGNAKTKSLKGEPVDIFLYNGIIPEDHFFVIGDSIDSFDSRYIGFVTKKEIEGVYVALF